MKICCRLGIGRWMYFWGSVSRKVQEKSSQRYSWEWLHGLWYFRYLTIVNTCKYCKCKYNKIKHDFQYTSDVIISHPVFFEYWELSTSTSRETGSCNKVYCWEALYICFALFCINIYIYICTYTFVFYYADLWQFRYDMCMMLCWVPIWVPLRLRCSLSWRTSFAPTSFGRLDRLHRISWSEGLPVETCHHSTSWKTIPPVWKILKGMSKGQWSHGGL